MYAIIATDGDIINAVRKNVVDELAPSMGENLDQDMQAIEYIVDDVNGNEGCHIYLGFGISPSSAKEECVHNALACGLHADNIVHGYFPMSYFAVALIPVLPGSRGALRAIARTRLERETSIDHMGRWCKCFDLGIL